MEKRTSFLRRCIALLLVTALMVLTGVSSVFAANAKTAKTTAARTAAEGGVDLSAYIAKFTDKASDLMTGDPMSAVGDLLENAELYNLLIVGVDSRVGDHEGRSDAMMILTVNNIKKTVTLTSLLRDSWVSIPGHGEDRLNAAYEYGGSSLLKKTIRQNYGISIDAFVTVNFQDLIAFVDDIGGIDMKITKSEVKVVNKYTSDQNKEIYGRKTNPDALPVKTATFHLNGMQALAYARVRYVGQDFGRTERQRKVISATLNVFFQKDIGTQVNLLVKYLQRVKTDLTVPELLYLVLVYATIDQYKTTSMALPADGTYTNKRIQGKDVLAVDLPANRALWRTTVGI